MFDEWLLDIWKMHTELNAYKAKRKKKAAIQFERTKRGYKAKKKTPLKDFQKTSK
jgi:hypothetical protein